MKKVMVFGTFDIVHLGHIALFKEAKKYGDELIVVVARDKRAAGIKGASPIFSEKERARLLSELNIIDKVILGAKSDVYKIIKDLKPDAIVLGYDQHIFTENLEQEIKKCNLPTRIFRANAYKPDRFKTNILKKHLFPNI